MADSKSLADFPVTEGRENVSNVFTTCVTVQSFQFSARFPLLIKCFGYARINVSETWLLWDDIILETLLVAIIISC